MPTTTFCDRIVRRDFLKAGVLGGLGLNLAGYLRLSQAGEVAPAKATRAILITLGGGPSHIDTFDPKPDAPAEYRGEFNPIATNVAGIQISEHLPKLAACADKFTILRGVSHNVAAHDLGQRYMNTGNRPTPAVVYPAYGSVVARQMPTKPELPTYVAIPRAPHPAGYLGVGYAPLETNSQPKPGRPFNVRGISIGGGLTVEQFERMTALRDDLDTAFAEFETQNPLLSGMDQFQQQVYAMITSREARNAFDIGQESPDVIKRFGDDTFGQSCLLAARLVESGVRFATVSYNGWDTHADNFNTLKVKRLPAFDTGLAALFTTLAERGLLESTVVMVTGEFGRTPKVNKRGGRDHWPRAMFVLMAGGGIRPGQVIGASDDKGAGPATDGITPEQVATSFYHALGISSDLEFHTPSGRPVMVVREGSVIPGLFS
jgi:uncharacterized protein (DUF1501 family)